MGEGVADCPSATRGSENTSQEGRGVNHETLRNKAPKPKIMIRETGGGDSGAH